MKITSVKSGRETHTRVVNAWKFVWWLSYVSRVEQPRTGCCYTRPEWLKKTLHREDVERERALRVVIMGKGGRRYPRRDTGGEEGKVGCVPEAAIEVTSFIGIQKSSKNYKRIGENEASTCGSVCAAFKSPRFSSFRKQTRIMMPKQCHLAAEFRRFTCWGRGLPELGDESKITAQDRFQLYCS